MGFQYHVSPFQMASGIGTRRFWSEKSGTETKFYRCRTACISRSAVQREMKTNSSHEKNKEAE